MGSVTELRISGDNDYPIFPVEYEMHYLYCDRCGSFDVEIWMERKKRFLFSRDEVRGARCRQSGATYEYGTPFFSDLEANPRQYTMDDVPLPLNRNYQMQGRVFGPVE